MKGKDALLAVATVLTIVMPAYANHNDGYKSWINSEVMLTDHRAYCSDIIAQDTRVNKGSQRRVNKGTNRQDNNGSTSTSNSYSQSSANSQSKKSSTNISAGHKGILSRLGRNISRSSNNSSSNRNSSTAQNSSERTWDKDRESTWDNTRTSTWEKTSVISKVAGKNCDVLLETAAQRDINHDQQLTNRMAIEAKERVRMEEMKTQSQMSLFDKLMQGW